MTNGLIFAWARMAPLFKLTSGCISMNFASKLTAPVPNSSP